MKLKIITACGACALLSIATSACNAPQPSLATNGQQQNKNASNRPGNSPSAPTSANDTATSSGMMGEAIDTSNLDAEIRQLETRASKKPNDQAARRRLAAAYLKRADALLKARQYRVALGDYRRVLKYDAGNREAQKWINEIVGIMQGMGRDVPAPGTEPTPLPFKS